MKIPHIFAATGLMGAEMTLSMSAELQKWHGDRGGFDRHSVIQRAVGCLRRLSHSEQVSRPSLLILATISSEMSS